MNSRKYFGTDGIRARAGENPLNPETLVKIGRAIAHIFTGDGKKHKILIAKDTRLSGYMIESALAAGITSQGVNVQLSGPIPTPAAAYLTKSMRADAGIMISASHNPFEDNGIKIFAADGNKLADEKELEIENIIDNQEKILVSTPQSIGKAYRIDDAKGRYIVYLKSCFPRELTLEGLKIGFDCANGAGYLVGPQTCEELGADVISRGVSPNGRNINSGFGSLYPEIVSKLVKENNLDIGIALDGDADRALFVDEKGNLIDGDMTLAICAIDLKERGLLKSGKIVATLMSNLGLEKFLKPYDIEVIRAPVGDRYVLEEMDKVNAELGGEQSGHTIFREYATTGDGVLTALMLMAIMKRSGKSLSELTANYIKFPQKLVNVQVREKVEFDTIPEIKKVIGETEKNLEGNGRLVVRYSGTENKARVMVECEDEKLCQKYANAVAKEIEAAIGTV
ncbi:MAG: phosphoglucosamine mutase [Bdellovibrionales bacterium]|nr:phosphoglucosamine mutase [Bdellovibrionales bacterium]